MPSILYDVAIAGGGPAGATCATLCAKAGLRTLMLEKSTFPRDKVCGDCLNPGCWPVLDELGVTQEVLRAPHAWLPTVVFAGANGQRLGFPLGRGDPGEFAITRRVFDSILLRRSQGAGVHVFQDMPIKSLKRDLTGIWRIDAGSETFAARRLVAADGRNSTVARLLGAAPSARRDRVGLQTHAPTPSGMSKGIELHLMPDGYCGTAPVGLGMTNFCMVAKASRLNALKTAVAARFGLDTCQEWRAIAPLERSPVGPLRDGVVFAGDAARVVEPFTGEGIYYALRSGSLAARHIARGTLEQYPAAHAALYKKRLWINRLARWAVTHPRAGAMLLETMSALPGALGFLVQRVTDSSQPATEVPREDMSRRAD